MEIHIKVIKHILGIPYKKKIKLKFETAKMIDVLNFIEHTKKKIDLWLWVIDFCKKFWKINKDDESSIYFSSGKIFEIIKETYFKWLFQETKAKWDDTPIISLITFVAKESSTSTLDILYKMTYEEFKLIIDGVIWNLNEQTKKGKQKNRLKLVSSKKENRSEEENQEIKEKLEKLRNLIN